MTNNIIIAKKLSCKVQNKLILDDINFDISRGEFISIVGPSGSGKSTLAKALLGLIPIDGYLNICNMHVCKNNIEEIRKNIGIVFENPDNYFVIDTVEDELAFTLENLNKSPENIKKLIDEVVNYLHIEKVLKKNINNLSGGEKQLVALASVLINAPKIIVLDEAFSMLDGESHKLLLDLIKKINQEKKITIINITHDMNDTIYSDRILVLDKGKIALIGTKDEVYADDKRLKSIGLNLPFMVDLSKRLGYYGLVDKNILNMNTMVKHLWK